MIKGLREHKISAVTISPQSLCSLAVNFKLTPQAMAVQLAAYFKSLGATYIVDSSFARLLSRKLCYKEFRELRMENRQSSATLFVGVCPGFVCYAEKTHGDLFIPLISRVRSPQAIMGSLVKDYLSKKLGVSPCDIYHVSVMPCFDKKLEASRNDFKMEEGVEVDCVVTAIELQPLLEQSWSMSESGTLAYTGASGLPNLCWLDRFKQGKVMGDSNEETSGGFASYVVNKLMEDFPGASAEREQKSKDLEVTTISFCDGHEPLRIAKLYGFKHIQNAVQKLKRNRLQMDFVEVMACPSGCGNGGGQLRGENSEQRAKITESVIANYKTLVECPDAEKELEAIEQEWHNLNNNYMSTLFTDYHSLKHENNLLKTSIPSW